MEYYSKIKEKTTEMHSNMEESQKPYTEQKKPETKEYMPYCSIHLKILNK